jgi:hypothetical protein
MFIAENVSFDVDRKLTASGIFDNILAPNFPAKHPRMCLVVNVEGAYSEKGLHPISVEFRDNDDNRIFETTQQIELGNPNITHGNLRAGVIFDLRDLLFKKPGEYQFVIFVDGRFLGRLLFTAQKFTIKHEGEA